jgi:hypothetical protein
VKRDTSFIKTQSGEGDNRAGIGELKKQKYSCSSMQA